MRDNILVVGSSGHAKVITDMLCLKKRCNIVGLIDDFKNKNHIEDNGQRILGKVDDIPELAHQHNVQSLIIAVGANQARQEIDKKIKILAPNIKRITAIHPAAIIASGVDIGAGTAVMAGVVINSGARIGENCIINTGSLIDHDCKMEDFSSVSPGAILLGDVCLGELSYVMAGAVVREKIKIGNNSVVGAGSLVLNEVPNEVLVYGAPAKTVQPNNLSNLYR